MSDPSQLWDTIRDSLLRLSSLQTTSASHLSSLDLLYKSLEDHSESASVVLPNIERLNEAAVEDFQVEKKTIQEVLGLFDVLIPLVDSRNPQSQPEEFTTPPGKRVKLDADSSESDLTPPRITPQPPSTEKFDKTAASPPASPSDNATPKLSPEEASSSPDATADVPSAPVGSDLPEKLQQSSAAKLSARATSTASVSAAPSPTLSAHSTRQAAGASNPPTRSNTPAPYSSRSTNNAPKQAALPPPSQRSKLRRDHSAANTMPPPLRPGRPIAYKQDPAAVATDETGWIQCVVLEYLGGEKQRYRVQDVESPEGKEGEPGLVMVTTRKYIIPLPDPKDKSTYPQSDYPPGSDVLALFPETTSFYKGSVIGHPTSRGGRKLYKVVFEDDDGIQRPVEAEFVTGYPH